jgi:hypothetical protein
MALYSKFATGTSTFLKEGMKVITFHKIEEASTVLK